MKSILALMFLVSSLQAFEYEFNDSFSVRFIAAEECGAAPIDWDYGTGDTAAGVIVIYRFQFPAFYNVMMTCCPVGQECITQTKVVMIKKD